MSPNSATMKSDQSAPSRVVTIVASSAVPVGVIAKKSSYRARNRVRARRSGDPPRATPRRSHAAPIASATALPATPAAREDGRIARARSATPKSAPSARARNRSPTRRPHIAPARRSPVAARANTMKNIVPMRAAMANESSVTHAGANAPPPRPARAAATSAARDEAPIDRAAAYATAGTKAATATIAA